MREFQSHSHRGRKFGDLLRSIGRHPPAVRSPEGDRTLLGEDIHHIGLKGEPEMGGVATEKHPSTKIPSPTPHMSAKDKVRVRRRGKKGKKPGMEHRNIGKPPHPRTVELAHKLY